MGELGVISSNQLVIVRMLAVHYTQRLVDGLSVSSGTLETDLMDIILNGKRLAGKVEDVQEKLLRFQHECISKISQWIHQFTHQISHDKVREEQTRTQQIIDLKRKEMEKKLLLIQLRNILRSKTKKIKTNLDVTYKSLSRQELADQEEQMDKLNSSIRMVEKDLGMEQQEGGPTNRSYMTQHTLESIEKDHTMGNESILSIENIVRRHEFILDSEIKGTKEEGEREIVTAQFSVSRVSERSAERKELTISRQKQQNPQISNKTSTKPKPSKDSSRKPPTVPLKSTKASKQSARIQQIKDNLMKYKEDLEQQHPTEAPVATMIKQQKQVVFSKSKSKGTFDEAIKQSYESLISQDLKR